MLQISVLAVHGAVCPGAQSFWRTEVAVGGVRVFARIGGLGGCARGAQLGFTQARSGWLSRTWPQSAVSWRGPRRRVRGWQPKSKLAPSTEPSN
jgi:hypothetical protein